MTTLKPNHYSCSPSCRFSVVKIRSNDLDTIKDQLMAFDFPLINYGDLLAPVLTNNAGEIVRDLLPPLSPDYTLLIWIVSACIGGGSMLGFGRLGDRASVKWCWARDGFAPFMKSLGSQVRLEHWTHYHAGTSNWYEGPKGARSLSSLSRMRLPACRGSKRAREEERECAVGSDGGRVAKRRRLNICGLLSALFYQMLKYLF